MSLYGSRLMIRLGDRDVNFKNDDGSVQERPVEEDKVTISEKFVYGQAYFDLAVIRFDPAVEITLGVRPICLPSEPNLDQDEHVNDLVRVTGNALYTRIIIKFNFCSQFPPRMGDFEQRRIFVGCFAGR